MEAKIYNPKEVEPYTGGLVISGDNLYLDTPLPQYGNDTYERKLIMTKEIFIECFNRWILSPE